MNRTSNKEKTEVIANLTAGNKVKFQYIKERIRDYNTFPCQTYYDIETYEGKLLEVRDTTVKVVDPKTVYRKPSLERSRYLIVVQLPDNKIKSFYDGRVVSIEEVKEVPKSFLKRTLDKIRGK